MLSSHLISQCQDALLARARADYTTAHTWWASHRDQVRTLVLDAAQTPSPPSQEVVLLAVACYALEEHALDWPIALSQTIDAWRAARRPEDLTSLEVVLWCWRARQLCLNSADLTLAAELFASIFERLEQPFAPTPHSGLLEVHAFARLSHMRLLTLQGELELARHTCTTLLEELLAPQDDPLAWGYIQELWHFKGILEQWSGDYEQAHESLYTAYLIAHERSGWQLAASAQAMLAQLHHLEGELELARQMYAQVDDLAHTHALTEREAFPIFVRVVRPFLLLELDAHVQARDQAQRLVDELTHTSAMLPLQLARSILIMATHACAQPVIARANHHILTMELAHRPGPLHPLGEMLVWLWEPEAMASSPLAQSSQIDKNLFLRFAERALGHLLGKLPTRHAIRYQCDGAWIEPQGEDGPRHTLHRKHTARRALLAMIQAGPHGLTRDALIARVWPDEHIEHHAALTRLRVLVHQLRGLGLREIVLTTEHGYRLDQSVPFIAVH